MEKRREDKTNTAQIKRTNVRRNVEKIRQILYKRTNVGRNVEKIRQILYKRTNVPRNLCDVGVFAVHTLTGTGFVL